MGCQAGSLGTKLGQSIFGCLIGNILQTGESADLGNTFWQRHVGKNKKTHLGRGLVKPSTEVRFFLFSEMRLPKIVTQVRGFTHKDAYRVCYDKIEHPSTSC